MLLVHGRKTRRSNGSRERIIVMRRNAVKVIKRLLNYWKLLRRENRTASLKKACGWLRKVRGKQTEQCLLTWDGNLSPMSIVMLLFFPSTWSSFSSYKVWDKGRSQRRFLEIYGWLKTTLLWDMGVSQLKDLGGTWVSIWGRLKIGLVLYAPNVNGMLAQKLGINSNNELQV